MENVWEWLTRLWRRSHGDDAIRELTNQFYVTLRAYMARIQANGVPRSGAVYERAQKLLDPARPQSWSDCYEVEQLMVDLYDDEMLRAELDLRRIEARNLRPILAAYYATAAAEAKTPPQQRALLLRLVNDLQWHYTVAESKRRLARTLTRRTGYFFLVAFTSFCVASFVWWTRWASEFSGIPVFLLAVFAGAWGATFSMLAGLTPRIDDSGLYDLRASSAGVMLLSRVLIGSCAAAILFFFIRSKLLVGTIFPKFPATEGALGIKAAALLIVWCFIAGFSEKLVPDLLARTEARIDTGPGHFPPTPLTNSVPAVISAFNDKPADATETQPASA